MKYVVAWKPRLGGSAAENEATAARVLEVFNKWTPASDVTFHQFVLRVDGEGGFAVTEGDDPATVARDIAKLPRSLSTRSTRSSTSQRQQGSWPKPWSGGSPSRSRLAASSFSRSRAALGTIQCGCGSDHLIRRLCHAHPLPAHSSADLPKQCSLVRSRRNVERPCAAKKRPARPERLDAKYRRERRLTDLGSGQGRPHPIQEREHVGYTRCGLRQAGSSGRRSPEAERRRFARP